MGSGEGGLPGRAIDPLLRGVFSGCLCGWFREGSGDEESLRANLLAFVSNASALQDVRRTRRGIESRLNQ